MNVGDKERARKIAEGEPPYEIEVDPKAFLGTDLKELHLLFPRRDFTEMMVALKVLNATRRHDKYSLARLIRESVRVFRIVWLSGLAGVPVQCDECRTDIIEV